jgi:hypothetical protein
MPTLTYTFVDRCAAGGHLTLDVSFNGGQAKRVTFETDTIRAALSEISAEEREEFAAKVLQIHCAGKTRGQLAAEFQNPVTVTI